MKKIVYLQSNVEKSQEVIDYISVSSIEFVHVQTGDEALQLFKTGDVILFWVDTEIKDMQLEEFLEEIRKISEDTVINVCVDSIDSKLMARLINKYKVGKIYVEPKDMQDVVNDLNSTLSEIVRAESEKSEAEDLKSEQEELRKTLTELTAKLKKQKNSYTKLIEFTDCFTDAVCGNSESDAEKKEETEFVKDAYRTFIRMQTTGTFDIEKFEESVKGDFRELQSKYKGTKTISVKSCLMGDQSKALVENIRFCIYLIARMYTEFLGQVEINVSSHYLTTKTVEFNVSVKSDEKITEYTKNRLLRYIKIAQRLMENVTDNARIVDEGNETLFCLEFAVIRKE